MGMQKQLTPAERRIIAASAGINEQYLWQCLTGRRDMNPAEARRIEDLADGLVTRQMLCQKSWQGIWPELAVSPAPSAQAAIDSVADEQAAADALRAGVVRRCVHRRSHDVPLDVDRRHSGPPFQAIEAGEA